MFAVLDRRKQARQAERHDQHADHLHHRDDPEDPVVGVVGRGKPRVIGPGPADGEAREAVAEQGTPVVALGDRMGELRGREPEAHDERQVEQQLERRRRPVGLVPIATTHQPRVMVEGVGTEGCGAHRGILR
jgi:hypothetical protein